MTVDPRIGFWLSIALAIIGVLAAGTTQLTTIFGEHTANIVLAISALIDAHRTIRCNGRITSQLLLDRRFLRSHAEVPTILAA